MKTATRIIEKKIKNRANGKNAFLLGQDADGTQLWLEAASWDYNWYWGFGYVTTKNSHEHIDSCFMIGNANLFNSERFAATTFTENEGWILSELFNTFYTLKATAELYHIGGSHVTTNPLADILKNDAEYERINKVLLPAIFAEIYKILSPKSK
jgi:hypothetical protein